MGIPLNYIKLIEKMINMKNYPFILYYRNLKPKKPMMRGTVKD